MRSRAFTLVELLVVIAIIALLLMILTPSLRQAKDLAKVAVCMTQTRSISQAAQIHASSRDHYLPLAGLIWDTSATPEGLGDPEEKRYVYYNDGGTLRPAPMTVQLGQYMGVSFRLDSRDNMVADIHRPEAERLFQCPAVSEPRSGAVLWGGGLNAVYDEPTSYGFNEGICGIRGAWGPGEPMRIVPPPSGNLRLMDNPSRTIFSLDSGAPELGPTQSLVFFEVKDEYWGVGSQSPHHGSLYSYWLTHAAHTWGTEFDFGRHNGKMCAAFLDEHCEAVPMGESRDDVAAEVWTDLFVMYLDR
jgi:prepilin-type N-terminal cleavage/methylation domain-containing protein